MQTIDSPATPETLGPTAPALLPDPPASATALSAPRFYDLVVVRRVPEGEDGVALSLRVPDDLVQRFAFQPGQYVCVRSRIHGVEQRRTYSVCSTPRHLAQRKELVLGIRALPGGIFSTWATRSLRVGDVLQCTSPAGQFVSTRPRARHRVGIVAGAGITPVLSILASTLQEQAQSRFTLVYGNRTVDSIMFHDALQDLKDLYPHRLTLLHILSRQSQEVALLQGRIDAAKVHALMLGLLPLASLDEVFVCGPPAMMAATRQALTTAGLPAHKLHCERFGSQDDAPSGAYAHDERVAERAGSGAPAAGNTCTLTLLLDGKTHVLQVSPEQRLLDAALAAGLDLPYACRAGVCCACRAKVLNGAASMDRNYGLEPQEIAQGFVLACQARCHGDVSISYDER